LTFAAVAIVIVAAWFTLWPFLTTQYVQVARVEGFAMSPTLDDQDRLLVDKRLSNAGEPMLRDDTMLLSFECISKIQGSTEVKAAHQDDVTPS
jgi:signal peptidase I